MYQWLPALPNRAPSGGLIALSTLYPAPPTGWEQGFSFAAEPCDDGVLYSSVCQVTTDKALVAADDRPGVTDYLPVQVIGADQCSTLSYTSEEVDGRARRHLRNIESHQLEVAFWTGEATDDPTANGQDRPHLADGTATVLNSGTAAEVVHGLALLDQALSDCLHGAPGMAHMTTYALGRAVAASFLRWENGRWLTPGGHTVVAGSGYLGIGPRANPGEALPSAPTLGGDQWAYGTAAVTTLLSDADSRSSVTPAVNDVTSRAERFAAAIHPPCCKFAVQLDFTP